MRASGILLPVSSLPSKYGIGCFSEEAYEFVDQLARAGQKYWQVLPVGPTSYGDSPYQSFSAFAGNPYFIDLDTLVEEELLTREEIDACYWGDDEAQVAYDTVFWYRFPLLKKAHARSEFHEEEGYEKFYMESWYWLNDYAFYMALKFHFDNQEWLAWPEDIRFRKKDAVERYLRREASRINDVVMERAAAYMKEGMTEREVADYIGSDHTEVYMTPDEVRSSLETVIELLGTYDITTIRASMGMYLVCKAIHQQTDIRVLLTGEISDELFGYKYTDFAPSAEEFQKEAVKRIRELHMYDVLRADRCISVNSLEARVPFGDLDFVEYVMSIDPEKKLNKYGIGKYLLRHAFEGDYLPHDILYREKAAFSDAVGHSMVDYLKEYAQSLYTDEEYERKRLAYTHAQPFTKESLLYREIFEKYYPGQSDMVVDFWMPNKAWKGCDVNDPSARVLPNYGDSGK